MKRTRREIESCVDRLFTDSKLVFLSYPLETIIAEKLETILARGIASTRPRDFYDVYTLSRMRWEDIDFSTLETALKNTMEKRNSVFKTFDYPAIIEQIRKSEVQRQLWVKYQRQYSYASDIGFEDTIDLVVAVMEEITNFKE